MKNSDHQVPQRFLELDALRGIACLFVVFFHFSMGNKEVNKIFKYGITGVDLFFMISGFVIFLTLNKTSDWRDFVMSRFSRLYPGYWACVSFTTILIISIHLMNHISLQNIPLEYLANMTMFQHYMGIYDLDGPYWTMITEMVFYIYMLCIFKFGGLKNTEKYCWATLLLVAFYSTFLNSFYPSIHHIVMAVCPLVNHFPLFFAGILFYKIKTEKASTGRMLGILACIVIQMSLLDDGKRAILYISQNEYIVMLSVYFALFILYILNSLQFIVNSFTLFLGKISYALYLSHQYLSIRILIPSLMNYVNFWLACCISLLLIIGLATVITLYIEKPALKYIRAQYNLKFKPQL